MKKILTLLPLVFFISIIILFQSCKKNEDPVTPPTERPVYEVTGTVGSGGAIVHVTTQTSPIKGVYVDIPEGAISSNTTITISQAPPNIKAPTDTTALVIQFEPKGLKFNSDVKIGLPYNPTNHDPSKLKAFYYDPDSAIVRELIIENVDIDKKIVSAYTNHFSKFYSGSSDVGADVEMFKINDKFAAKIRIFGNYQGNLTNTIYGIPTLPLILFPLQLLYPNLGIALENYNNYNALVGISVALYEDNIWPLPSTKRDECYLLINRWDYSYPLQQRVNIKKHNLNIGQSQSLYIYPVNSWERLTTYTEIDQWYSGKTLIFKFENWTPSASKKYYVAINFALASNPNLGYPIGGRITELYALNNSGEKKKISEVSDFIYDTDNNYVDDRYQPQNQPPLQPSNPTPSNNATGQSISPTLSWECSDPDGDPITYDVWLGTTNPPTQKVSSAQTGVSYNASGLQNNKTYYWQIFAKDNQGHLTNGTVWQFTTAALNQPPLQPSNPVPSMNAINQSINVDISWQCSDPESDPLTYDIYFGTAANPPLVKSSHTTTSYDPGVLSNSTDYFWKIVAKDNHSNSTASAVWKFTTIAQAVNQPPLQPSNPVPSLNAINQSINVDISWQCSDPESDPLTYDIYFGTAANPPLVKSGHTTTSYDPGVLSNSTDYFWKIVAKDNHSNSTASAVWKFTTIAATVNQPPLQPSNPVPSLNAINQSINVDISWQCSDPESDPLTYDIYFGTAANPPLVKSGHTTTSYDPGVLSNSTDYFWKIVAKDNHSNSTAGAVWKFTTIAAAVNQPPLQPSNPTPANNTTSQSTSPILSWECSDPEGDPITYDVYFGTSVNPPLLIPDYPDNFVPLFSLNGITDYYWKIVAKDNHSNSTTGAIWKFTTVTDVVMNVPCPGMPTVVYEYITYNTVLIGTQCWLKENLNVGIMIPGTQEQINNVPANYIEKYCYDDNPTNCTTYGGLYQWNEAMQYVTTEETRGICPPGWHIPTKVEFETLAYVVNWDGNALKREYQGSGGGQGTNTSGFSAFLAGLRDIDSTFTMLNYYGTFWGSTEYDMQWKYFLQLYYGDSSSNIGNTNKEAGFSVRCVKD
jgi:uncharacterized protein (TIGR02145 family)